MKLKRAVVFAASLCLMEAVLSANSGPARAEWANPQLPPPFGMRTIAIPSSIKGEEVASAALSGSGLLALGTAAGNLWILDRNLRPWRGGWQRSAPSSAISGLTFSHDEAAIAGITDEAVVVWRRDDQTAAKIPVKALYSAIALSPGGRWLAVTHFGLSVFDVSSLRLVRQFEQEVDDGGAGVYEAVAFTPDAVVAAASLDNIDAWNIESGKRVRHWKCKCGADGVAFSRDAALAVVGTTDAHALLWDLASAQVLKDKTISALEGDHVYGTAVSLKGTLVATGTAAGEVVVWDTVSGVIIGRAQPGKQPILRITSSDDGQVLLVEGQKAEYVRGSYDRWFMTLTQH
jgi:WD40 repeat protein